jgi:hypothetical protein
MDRCYTTAWSKVVSALGLGVSLFGFLIPSTISTTAGPVGVSVGGVGISVGAGGVGAGVGGIPAPSELLPPSVAQSAAARGSGEPWAVLVSERAL